METAPAQGIWAFAETDATVLGVVVGCVMVSAAAFLLRRLMEQVRSRQRR